MSLYRKYRPQTFEDVVGQDHVARTLRNALGAQPPRVAHAYLFTGPRGIGKTTNARLMAKCLNCAQGPTATPCNQCDFCIRVANNQPVMDMLEIDAASNTGVDNIREAIIDKVNMAPVEGRYRITIIDEVHMLSTSSFNALLKTLEEPPPTAIFILATTDVHKVPQTILSRCQRFDFRRVTPSDIAKRLLYVANCEGIKLHEDAAKLLARHADGALRDALTLLEQVSAFAPEEITPSDVRLVLGGVPQELLNGVVDGVIEQDPRAVLGLLEKALEEGASFSQLCRELTAYVRDLLLVSVGFGGDETLSPQEKATRQNHAQALGRAKIEALVGTLREAEKEMRSSSDHRLLLEITLVRACEGNFGASVSVAPTPVANAPKTSRVVSPFAAPTPKAVPNEELPKNSEAHPINNEVKLENKEVDPVNNEAKLPNNEARLPQNEESPINNEVSLPQSEANPENKEENPVQSEEPASAPTKSRGKGRRISTFADLEELWPALLMRIRKKIGVTSVAWFSNARPVGLTDDEVILEFNKEFHHAKALDSLKRLPFEEKVNEVLDKPRRLRLVLAEEKPEAAPAAETTASDDDDEDDLGSEDIIDFTQKLFAAEIVGRSG